MSEYSKKQAAMEELLGKLANAENRLRMDNQKLKGQLLKDQIQDLETKKMDYEIQLNEAGLSIPEARDRILARMKEDNQAIVNMEKSIKDSKKNIDIYEKRLREL
jgi:intraflagellar transport protein 74